MPVILYQVWAFVAPALYKHERRLVMPLLVSSTLLFCIGMAFAYFVVFPLAFGFLTHAAPEGVRVSTDIRSYLRLRHGVVIRFWRCGAGGHRAVLDGRHHLGRLRKNGLCCCVVGAFPVWYAADAAGRILANAAGDSDVLPVEVGVFFARFYTGKRLTRDEDAAAEEAGSKEE